MSSPSPVFLCGWSKEGSLVAAHVVRGLLEKDGKPAYFHQAAPHLLRSSQGISCVVLHDTARKVPSLNGQFLNSQWQGLATCVGRGAKRIVDLTQCVHISHGEPLDFSYTSHAFIYGNAREHGRWLGVFGGAYGSWAAWSVVHDGNLSNEEAGDDDNYDDMAWLWGWRGVPREMKEKGARRLIKSVCQPRSFEDVADAVVNGYGVTVCSDIGFGPSCTQSLRDRDGVVRAEGEWHHQMAITGYCSDLDGRGPALLEDQSYGPDNPKGPLGLYPIPSYSFWVLKEDAERQISCGDTWIYSGISTWPVRYHSIPKSSPHQ